MSGMGPDVVVVDDFYADPDGVRAFALRQEFTDFDGHKAFLGRESLYPYFDASTPARLSALVSAPISYTDEHIFGKFRIAGVEESRRTKVHIDRASRAANVYLTPGLSKEFGLGIYRHRELGLDCVPSLEILRDLGFASLDEFDRTIVMRDSLAPDRWELIELIEPAYNRLVIIPGGRLFHAAEGGTGTRPDDARLSQHFFFEIDD